MANVNDFDTLTALPSDPGKKPALMFVVTLPLDEPIAEMRVKESLAFLKEQPKWSH